MRKLIAGTLMIAGALLYASCGCHDEKCASGGIAVRVTGFDSAALSGVVLRRYDTGSAFTRLHDTSLTGYNAYPGDTTLSGMSRGVDFDDEYFFPAINKTVRLYDFRYDLKTEKVCVSIMEHMAPCLSPITSYMQDGQRFQVDSVSQRLIISR